jgi:nucleoside phosphorylase
MKVFITAMECEAQAVIRNLADVRERLISGRRVVFGSLSGTETAVVVSGVGKVNAAAGTQLAIGSLNAKTIINVGVAGGLEPSLTVGSVYSAIRAVEYDFDLSNVNGSSVGIHDERDTPFYELAKVDKATATELIAKGGLTALANADGVVTTQKVSAYLKKLVDCGRAVKVVEKKKTYFSVAEIEN